MYLSDLKLWNFRKYGSRGKTSINDTQPDLSVQFQDGLNVLVGENNSGKTAIIDAIRLVLYTQVYEYFRIDERDFFSYQDENKQTIRTTELKIECIFKGFSDREAASFLEWLGFDVEGKHYLRIWLYAYFKDNRVISDIKTGPDDEGMVMDAAARDLLRVTYLKPLRDADAELSPSNRSRLSHILRSEPIFRRKKDDSGKDEKHALEIYIKQANDLIREYFEKDVLPEGQGIPADTKGGKHIVERIELHLKSFLDTGSEMHPYFEISGSDLLDILNRLSLNLEENKTGLGVLNQLFIAAELILLQREEHRGLRLCLIEELEAHLHPQAQLRMIDFLSKYELNEGNYRGQFILTTHSITLASKIKLSKLILCYGDKTFPFFKGKTELENDDYQFLERFLDATKANLFFAKGVIIIEGDAENILIPAVAEILGRNLHANGVSIVNVGSKALLRYAKILIRKGKDYSPLKVSIVTDLDIAQYRSNDGSIKTKQRKNIGKVPIPDEERRKIENTFNTTDQNKNVQVFISPLWTLEYDLAKSGLKEWLYQAIKLAQLSNSRTKNCNFQSLNQSDISRYCTNAINEFKLFEDEYSHDPNKIAFRIYQKLETKRASKAVTAQWLSYLLIKEKAITKSIIEKDDQLKYLREAIYHVTTPP